ALDLRAHPLRVDAEAAVDRGVDARHRDVALAVDLHLDHSRDVGDERAVRRDAEAAALRQLPAPAAALGRKLGNLAQPAGVDLERAVRLAVVPPGGRDLLADL